MKISEILKEAAEILRENGIAEARREAGSLLTFALRKDRTFLIAHSEYELSEEETRRFQSFLKRRKNREPFQYIVGKQEFFGLDFIVTKDVLIPRPETELIVENALKILHGKTNPRFLEIGVGSGCISISILHKVANASAVAVDISGDALQIARKNSENHLVSKRLELKISNTYADLKKEKFDLIVSNPPYIDVKDLAELQPEVREFEPESALTDGKNGLSIIEKIIKDAPQFLKPDGFLLIEIGFNQSEEVRRMCLPEVWRSAEFLNDLQGIRRMLKARLM